MLKGFPFTLSKTTIMLPFFSTHKLDAGGEKIKPPIVFNVENGRRSPYRFKATNRGWYERDGDVIVEAFRGRRRLVWSAWSGGFGFPNVYRARAAR